MTLPYLPRLLCLAMASFFLVHLVTAAIVSLLAPLAIRTAQGFAPRHAARFLLILCLLPLAMSVGVALGLCVPSYLWFEPERFDEPVGLACLLLAMLGLGICGAAVSRTIRAGMRSMMFARRCRRSGYEMAVAGQFPPTFVVEESGPFLALTGIARPRVVISESILDALSGEELSVVLRHERAHRTSRDNLKRLLIFLAPGIMPFLGGGRALERAWNTLAEYAADEEAVGGDVSQSLALASALVRVARFGSMRGAAVAETPFLGEVSDLATRVDRLLTSPQSFESPRQMSRCKSAWVVLAAGCVAAVIFQPATLRFVHSLMERLIG
jgi:Zn-dependent protease with chaperone function